MGSSTSLSSRRLKKTKRRHLKPPFLTCSKKVSAVVAVASSGRIRAHLDLDLEGSGSVDSGGDYSEGDDLLHKSLQLRATFDAARYTNPSSQGQYQTPPVRNITYLVHMETGRLTPCPVSGIHSAITVVYLKSPRSRVNQGSSGC